MSVNRYVVESIIKARKSKSPPIRQLKDILNDKVIKENGIFRLSVNDFIKMRDNVVLRRMMTKPLNTNLQKLTIFCNIIAVEAKNHIDLSAKKINEKLEAPLLKTIRDLSAKKINEKLEAPLLKTIRDLSAKKINEKLEAPLLKTIRDLPDEIIDKIIGHYDSMISTIFTSLKTFLVSLSNEVEKGHTLIANIVASLNDDDKTGIVNSIRNFFVLQNIEEEQRKEYFNGDSPDTDDFSKLIKTFIRNIYLRFLYPSSKKTTFLNVEYFSQLYFEDTKLPSNIKRHLISFMNEYTPKLDDRLVRYMSYLIDDVIHEDYVLKLSKDDRDKAKTDDKLYYNNYYLLIEGIEVRNTMEQKGEVVGTGVLTPNKRFVIEKESTKNDFTHEECKMWAMMPIFNPRTLEPILIDSPIYNLLLSKSYHYDKSLIPRMITSRGYKVIYGVLFTKNSESSSSSPHSGQYM